MSWSPAKILLAPIVIAFECGQFGSMICGEVAFQVMPLSLTSAPGVVGQSGSIAPLMLSGCIVHSISVPSTASQITWLSVTCTPSAVGHLGSVPALLPGAAWTALNNSPDGVTGGA